MVPPLLAALPQRVPNLPAAVMLPLAAVVVLYPWPSRRAVPAILAACAAGCWVQFHLLGWTV